MSALTRLDLDLLKGRGCENPGCSHDHDGPIFLHSNCHPKIPTWSKYEDGVLTIICSECRKRVTEVQVAKASEDL